jgi:hypothetical protein
VNGQVSTGQDLLEVMFYAIKTHFIRDDIIASTPSTTECEDRDGSGVRGKRSEEKGSEDVNGAKTLQDLPPIDARRGSRCVGNIGGISGVGSSSSVGGNGNADDDDTSFDRERSVSNGSIGEGSFYRPAGLEHLLNELRLQEDTPPPLQPSINTATDATTMSSTNAVTAKNSVVDSGGSGVRTYAQVCTDFIELLLRFLLIALSRTYSSGILALL